MKSNNILQQKSFAFAIRIVKAYKYLKTEKREFELSKQLLRSGTSAGANIDYLSLESADSLLTDAEELCRITAKILISSKKLNS